MVDAKAISKQQKESFIIGVTIGIGEGWREVAEVAAKRMSEMTGLDCLVVYERFRAAHHPSWLKCHIIDYFGCDSYLLFDADIIPLKKWDAEGLFKQLGRAFCAVPDVRTDKVFDECNDLGIPFPDCYINGGLTMFGREHKIVWEKTWHKHPKCGKWLEQGALNLALLEVGCEVCRLPRRFNVLTYKGRALEADPFDHGLAINLHLSGTGCAQGVKEIQKRYGMDQSSVTDRSASHNAEAVSVR